MTISKRIQKMNGDGKPSKIFILFRIEASIEDFRCKIIDQMKSLINNWIVAARLALEAFKAGSKLWD